ncbi:MAG: FtsW/RodA/SpoVE family cell cycle protein [Clostridiales bacterium]|nr:FtsW/RodA/SpoVE family cell cycle protein [Clostridiales bacterium]
MDLLKKIFKGDPVIWIIYGLLCVISIIEVFSAASTLTYESGNHWLPIRQHVTMLAIGLAVVILFQHFSCKGIKTIGFTLWPLSIILLLAVITIGLITGERINGASRWMSIFGFQFQPSELAKMSVIILTAYFLARYRGENDIPGKKAFKYIAIIVIPIISLIAPENLSTAVLIAFVAYLMLIVGRLSSKILLKITGTGVLVCTLFLGALYLVPSDTDLPLLHRLTTWKSRVENFMSTEIIPPEQFDLDKDAQIAHANIAIASSHFVGKGPGNSIQRDFLSQAFSDFIYAIIIEEFGLILGAGGVVLLYLWLLIRVGRIANKCKHPFPALMIIGVALMLVTQALINMMVAVDLIPVTGQPLPLISKGGTSTIINSAYIGIILSVSRYAQRKEQEDIDKEEEEVLQKKNEQKVEEHNILEIAPQ